MGDTNASFLDAYRKAINSGSGARKVLTVIAVLGAIPAYCYFIRPTLKRRDYREQEKAMLELYNKQKEMDNN